MALHQSQAVFTMTGFTSLHSTSLAYGLADCTTQHYTAFALSRKLWQIHSMLDRGYNFNHIPDNAFTGMEKAMLHDG
jgi:hypothetical protein